MPCTHSLNWPKNFQSMAYQPCHNLQNFLANRMGQPIYGFYSGPTFFGSGFHSIGKWHLALKEVLHFSLHLRATFLSLLLLASFLGDSEMLVIADDGPAVTYLLYQGPGQLLLLFHSSYRPCFQSCFLFPSHVCTVFHGILIPTSIRLWSQVDVGVFHHLWPFAHRPDSLMSPHWGSGSLRLPLVLIDILTLRVWFINGLTFFRLLRLLQLCPSVPGHLAIFTTWSY